MTTAIRITLTPELKLILEKLKQVYPALNDAELIKMAVSGFFSSIFDVQNNSILDDLSGPEKKNSKILNSKIIIKHNTLNDSYSIAPARKSNSSRVKFSSLKFKQALRSSSNPR